MSFQDRFDVNVRGRINGFVMRYVAPGSDGQAFLEDTYYSTFEVLKNPANGKKMYASGRARSGPQGDPRRGQRLRVHRRRDGCPVRGA